MCSVTYTGQIMKFTMHRDNDMGTVAVFCDNLQSVDCVHISNDIVKNMGSVFFHPTRAVKKHTKYQVKIAYQGSS